MIRSFYQMFLLHEKYHEFYVQPHPFFEIGNPIFQKNYYETCFLDFEISLKYLYTVNSHD